jgi:hypothetical protein
VTQTIVGLKRAGIGGGAPRLQLAIDEHTIARFSRQRLEDMLPHATHRSMERHRQLFDAFISVNFPFPIGRQEQRGNLAIVGAYSLYRNCAIDTH